MKKTLSTAAFVLLYSLVVFVILSGLATVWNAYDRLCIWKDVLQWDGNIRYIQVVDQWQDIRDGHTARAILFFFEGNVWPPLRSILSLVLFLVSTSGPTTVLDTTISFAFFALLFPTLLALSLRLVPGRIAAVIVFLFTTVLIFQAPELPAYGLASMLETQGMFFVLWTVYALYRAHEWSAGAEIGAEVPGRLKGLLLFAGLGLFLTKYPYGVMFILAVVLFECARSPKEMFEFAWSLIRVHYRGIRLVLAILLAGIFVALLFAGNLGYTGLNKKAFKYFLYLAALIAFVDLNVFFYRTPKPRTENEGYIPPPRTLTIVYLFCLLPGITWILLHPDRFGSVIGGQFWILKQTSSFVKTLLVDVTDSPIPMAVAFAAGLGAFAFRIAHARGKILERTREVLSEPAAVVLVVVILQVLLQEAFSPNKQYRHIYHLVPATIFVLGLAAARFLHIHDHGSTGRWAEIVRRITLGLFVAAAVFLLTREGGLLTGTYSSARPFCYTGTDPATYAEARWVAETAPLEGRTLVLNLFHDLPPDPGGHNQASEIDVLLRKRALSKSWVVRNDSPHRWNSWAGFDRVLFVADQCENPDRLLRISGRAQAVGAQLTPGPAVSHPTAPLCYREFKIEKKEKPASPK